MKRFFILLAVVLTSMLSAKAKEVSPSVAESIAREVLGATRGGDVAVAWDSSVLGTTRGTAEAPTFYVVAAQSGVGFVIVAGDDVVAPILAYSTQYAAPTAEVLPPNFEGWLRYVDIVVRYAREHGMVADKATAEKWSEGYKPVAATMLNTARWSQVEPYNNECPIDGDAHSLTGCTQTAMAIIMHHYRWPERAKGVTEAYTTKYGLDVSARDLNHAYDWDSMIETYVEGEYSDVQAEAIAVLMADLGHAFQADYTATDTAAMPDMAALYQNFGYSPASHIAVRNGNSDGYWVSVLRDEIEANRPVFYAGYTAEWAGHAFVLDGVDANDYFHVNWGWGGVYDGFFLIDGLMLGEEYLFDTQHWAVFGMHPLRDGEIDNWLVLSSSGLSVEPQEFERGKQFVVKSISYSNLSQLAFKGEMRVALCNAKGERKSWVTETINVDMGVNMATSEMNIAAVINDEIVEGDRLCVFYKSSSSDEWYRMYGSVESACDEVVVKYAPIGETTSMSFDKASGLLVVKYDEDVKSALYMLSTYVERGVTITKGRMVIDTKALTKGAEYTIYLERKDVEQKSIVFTLKEL